MNFAIRLHVWGEQACFTRPEMKVERVSYDIMTPSAARGLLEAIYWKPGMCWLVTHLHVLRPIRFRTIRRNEVAAKISLSQAERAMRAGHPDALAVSVAELRQQRATTLLTDVGYVITARCVIPPPDARAAGVAKHLAVFSRRAAAGQCFHQPYLGTRDCPAYFRLLSGAESGPDSTVPADQRDRDLGWMFYDLDYAAGGAARFFRARLVNSVLDVSACLAAGQAS